MATQSSTFAWKNPMDGGAWQATVHGVTNSQIRLSDFTSLIGLQISSSSTLQHYENLKAYSTVENITANTHITTTWIMWFLIYILCLITYLSIYAGFLGDSVVKNPPVNAGDAGNMGSIPGLGNLLEEEMATHSTILTWEIPWTEDPGRLEPMWLQRVRHN